MRIVIKVGTSTIAHKTGHLNIRHMEQLCRTISDLKNSGHEIILVSSGAIGMGIGKLGLLSRPSDMPSKQAAAAIGQCELMYVYDKEFSQYNHTIAQLLITNTDVETPENSQNFKNTLNRLLELGALPIINENDTVSTEEISIGDNDTLSAIVAVSINADLLVLLSDIDGVYTADPHKDPAATLIPLIPTVDASVEALAGDVGSALGTGGMRTKVNAAKLATAHGIDMIITNGDNPTALYDIADGKPVGTRFVGRKA